MGSKRIIWLRAVNVGGATVPMAQLRAILYELGATDVQTYIQSGNIVCVPPGDPIEFDRQLEQAIEGRFGFFREAISRAPAEVSGALAAHPFDVIEPRFSYITFLLSAPTPAAISKARSYEIGDDRWQIIGRDLHIRYARGAGRPDLRTASIGRALAVPGTARNLNTVQKMIELAGN